MTVAAWKLALPLLNPACCAAFADRPLVWSVRGFYRASHPMAGQTCGATLYTSADTSPARARELAETENRFMRVSTVTARGWSFVPDGVVLSGLKGETGRAA